MKFGEAALGGRPTMLDAEPPRRGVLRKRAIYRVPALPLLPGWPREPDSEVVEIIRRVEARKIGEYLEKRKRAS